jgi:DNA-binding transcriptional regulator LsrR (DeoR family)
MDRPEGPIREVVAAASASGALGGTDPQLVTRAAWLYFIAGMTQEQVAQRLGLSRIRVNRLIGEAREAGIVEIRINGRLADCVALEEQLIARFGCREAIVLPRPGTEDDLPRVIGAAAGAAISSRLEDGMSIGIGWGRTLRYSIQAMQARPLRQLSVVSLLGGLTHGSVMNSYETASRVADLFSAECLYIAAPAFPDTEEIRNILLGQGMVQDAFAHARKVDLAFVSVGALSMGATMARLGLIKEADVASLTAARAVGDICAHWIDDRGQVVDHPLNRRVLAIEPRDLTSIPTVVLASGGQDKIAALHGALSGGYVDVFVTDEASAAGILAYAALRSEP